MLPLVKIISTRKTPSISQWWIMWNAEKLGPFILERDACRRAADMIEMAWSDLRDAPYIPKWQDMATYFRAHAEKDDVPTRSMIVGASRAARDALLLTLSSAEWSEQLGADALTHAGQWLAPLLGAAQDVIRDEYGMALAAEGSRTQLRFYLPGRRVWLGNGELVGSGAIS